MGGVVDKAKASKQWNELKTTIESEGVKVVLLYLSCNHNPTAEFLFYLAFCYIRFFTGRSFTTKGKSA